MPSFKFKSNWRLVGPNPVSDERCELKCTLFGYAPGGELVPVYTNGYFDYGPARQFWWSIENVYTDGMCKVGSFTFNCYREWTWRGSERATLESFKQYLGRIAKEIRPVDWNGKPMDATRVHWQYELSCVKREKTGGEP